VLRGIVVVVYKVVFLLLHSYNSLSTLLIYFFLYLSCFVRQTNILHCNTCIGTLVVPSMIY
jgi:hypothetical protein